METIEQTQSLKSRHVWGRGLSMLFFMFALSISISVLGFLAVVQFLWLLISGEINQPISRFGKALAIWIAAVARFQTGASDERPMPWADWPSVDQTPTPERAV